MIVGAKKADKNTFSNNGAIYIVSGSSSASGTSSLSESDTMLAGTTDGGEAGISASAVDDLDGDGIPEFMVGAYRNNSNFGEVHLIMSQSF